MKKGFRIIKFKKSKARFEFINISKSFNGRSILKKISLKVYPGEIVGLLGPNGAGKSTLFNIAIGAENEDSGNILIDGKSIKDIPIHLRSKSGLAYLSQTRSLFDNLSVFDNLHGLVQLFEKDQKKAIEKTELLLNNFNLVHLRGLKAAALSGGESKRVSLARLMISNPKVVLIDELFSFVDPIVIQEMQKYILQIQSQGVSCILTEHSIDSLFQISDRNYLIAEGNIVAEGTKSELLKNSTAIKSYFGQSYKND